MRAANTYRAERRNLYFTTEALRHEYSWPEWNRDSAGIGFQIGSALPSEMRHAIGHVSRSKYMPHIGKKERARYAVPSHGREATE